MRYVKWTIFTLLGLIIFAFLHYTLPQRDIVRIADTYEKRIDFGENSIFWAAPDTGNALTGNRDVFFIQAIRKNGKPVVYRNEDTGWGWPPYFKFDTSNLQAQATDFKSTKDAPTWVAMKHYGWRNEFMSIFPNAVGVSPVAGPDVTLIPWLNIIIMLILLALIFFIVRIWQQFRERSIDPLIEDAGEAYGRVGDRAGEARGRFGRWVDTWKSPKRK